MASLLQPYIPNVGSMLDSATQGYKLGEGMRQRDLSIQAGGLAAGGNLRGARDALYKGGDFSGAGAIDDKLRAAAREAKTEQLEQAAKFNAMLGNLAMMADTPEKWEKATAAAAERGIDVSQYRDFASRDLALAQAGKVKEFLDLELNRRKTDREQPAYEFTKRGVGNRFTGEFKPYADEDGADPELTLEQGKYEQGLRKEYTALTSDLRTINDSIGRMRKASTTNSGAGDIAMVYSFMKMLDPTSVVREGEYATAENTGGVPERIVNVYNKIISGQRLTPAQRKEFLDAGEALAGDKAERFQKLRGQFENIARKGGADPARIMLDEGMAQTAPESGGGGDIPPEAVKMLRQNPTPQMRTYFDETFGRGAAERALGQ